MDDLTQLLRVISATEIVKKWNVTNDRLNAIVEKFRLPLYHICEKRARPDDGKIIYFCTGSYFKFYYKIKVINYQRSLTKFVSCIFGFFCYNLYRTNVLVR